MVDATIFPALRAAIKQNELGTASPYCLSYACKGQSGASFGIFQGDTNVNPLARGTLTDVLNAAGVEDAKVAAIVAALSRPLPDGSPLHPDDQATANDALAATFGQTIVDQMDEQLMQTVLHGIDSCLAVRPIDPTAQLYLALWINMTGAPTTLLKWLAQTASGSVSATDIEGYLQATAYFSQNPKNFAHMQASVTAGAALLPGA
jgi:hypothetical protein